MDKDNKFLPLRPIYFYDAHLIFYVFKRKHSLLKIYNKTFNILHLQLWTGMVKRSLSESDRLSQDEK
jgi:hypothetical protein